MGWCVSNYTLFFFDLLLLDKVRMCALYLCSKSYVWMGIVYSILNIWTHCKSLCLLWAGLVSYFGMLQNSVSKLCHCVCCNLVSRLCDIVVCSKLQSVAVCYCFVLCYNVAMFVSSGVALVTLNSHSIQCPSFLYVSVVLYIMSAM